MTAKLAIVKIISVEAVDAERFEVRVQVEDTSELVLVMDGPTLCSLADKVSHCPLSHERRKHPMPVEALS
jgi:hypothetical protein